MVIKLIIISDLLLLDLHGDLMISDLFCRVPRGGAALREGREDAVRAGARVHGRRRRPRGRQGGNHSMTSN